MRYHKMFHLHGIRYESRKDPSVKRQRLIERITTDSVLDLERFEYKGEPALMVIDPKSGLDIGVVPAEDVGKRVFILGASPGGEDYEYSITPEELARTCNIHTEAQHVTPPVPVVPGGGGSSSSSATSGSSSASHTSNSMSP
jgi:hypothetical protein